MDGIKEKKKRMICRCCGNDISVAERVKNVNVEVCNVFSSPVNTPKIEVDLYTCNSCGHHQIENIFSNDHYIEYNLLNVDSTKTSGGGNASARMPYYNGVLQRLRALSSASGKILDVGCGHGEILCNAKEYFHECIGVEPSDSESEIARHNVGDGGRIITAFFDDDFSEIEFDALISTQVFEHLEDPENAMVNALRVLKSGGVAYFDVPNGQRIYNNSEYYNIYAEHVNYYTLSSLAYLARRAGFDIIEISEIMDGNHIAIYVRKPKEHIEFDDKRVVYIEKIEDFISDQDNISIWGCGIKGRNFISCLSNRTKEKIKYIFDSNSGLTGCYVNDCAVPISIPEKDKLKESSIVILTATEYKKEIMHILQEEYKYRGKVIVLDDELQ